MLVRGLIEASTAGPSTGTINLPGPWGLALRGKTAHANSMSAAWQTTRAETYRLAIMWRNTISSGQRNQWNLEASSFAVHNRHGRTKFLNGFQLFVRDNAARVRAGFGARQVPGTSQAPPPFKITDLAQVAGPIFQVFFRPTDPWLTDTAARCVLIDRGLLDTTKRYRNRRGIVVAVLTGIPVVGYPNGALVVRSLQANPQTQFIVDGYSITST